MIDSGKVMPLADVHAQDDYTFDIAQEHAGCWRVTVRCNGHVDTAVSCTTEDAARTLGETYCQRARGRRAFAKNYKMRAAT